MPVKVIILLFSVFVAGIRSGEPVAILFSCAELFLICYLTDLLYVKHKKAAYVVNSVLSLMFFTQQAVLYFSGEFISQLMLDNINMLDSLGDKLVVYIVGFAAVVLISFLPYRPLKRPGPKKWFFISLAVFLGASVFVSLKYHDAYSPFGSVVNTIFGMVDGKSKRSRHVGNKSVVLEKFRRTSIESSGCGMQLEVPAKPNIIMLFVEGLSAEVIDVFNSLDRDLTPNLNDLYGRSLVFTNYYNHTAATFRGLRGQLYSGYQYPGGATAKNDGFDQVDAVSVGRRTSTQLVSLTDIFSDIGYHTSMINVESNKNMVAYFRSFNFDKVISADERGLSSSDKDALRMLADVAEESKEPYFTCMYTVGTHHGFDSPDVKYGDGSNPVLNKFHNLDAQFGYFFERMKREGHLENTILVFTTDHASYSSPEYKAAFGSSQKYFVATVPLFIYWPGIDPAVIDAGGRNSLDLAPTVLDLIGLHDNENYFLGTSLFLPDCRIYSRISAIGDNFYYTGDGPVRTINNEKKFRPALSDIYEYYIISVNE